MDQLQTLDILNLTTLAERRNRGDPIEVYKAVNGNSSIGNLFNIGRSGINLVSDIRVSKGGPDSTAEGSTAELYLPTTLSFN